MEGGSGGWEGGGGGLREEGVRLKLWRYKIEGSQTERLRSEPGAISFLPCTKEDPSDQLRTLCGAQRTAAVWAWGREKKKKRKTSSEPTQLANIHVLISTGVQRKGRAMSSAAGRGLPKADQICRPDELLTIGKRSNGVSLSAETLVCQTIQ